MKQPEVQEGSLISRTSPAASSLDLDCSATRDQVVDEHDDGDHQDEMNQSAGYVKTKAEEP